MRPHIVFWNPAIKKIRLLLLLCLAAIVGVGLAVLYHSIFRCDPEVRFTDLETALATERENGWELAVPPKRGGPYRLLPGGPVLGRSPESGLGGRLRDSNGAVIGEIKLQGAEDRDQCIVYLKTLDGHITMAALVRVK